MDGPLLWVFQVLRRAACRNGWSTVVGVSGGKEGGVPEWMVHFASAVFGVMVLHTLFRLAFLYLALCCTLAYLLLVAMAPRGRHLSGVAMSALIAVFLVFWYVWD